MVLPRILLRFGVSIDSILTELSLPPDLLSSPDNTIDVEEAGRLLERCATRSGCAHIGLLVGQTVSAATYGLPGLLMQASGTLGMALRSFVMSLHFNGRAVIPTFLVHGDTAVLGANLTMGINVGRPIGLDVSLAVGCQLIRTLVGADWKPSEVRMARRAPADPRPYRRFFGVDVTFDTERSVLIFPAIWLDKPVATADMKIRHRIERLLATPAETDAEFVLFCKRAIMALIVRQEFSVAGVAVAMKLHRRTLNRRLAALGTSVPVLAAEVRFALARQLLTDTSLPAVEIASAIGYSDASTFTRSFKAWSGKAPSAWRRSNAGNGVQQPLAGTGRLNVLPEPQLNIHARPVTPATGIGKSYPR